MAKKGYFSTFFTKVNNAVLKNEKLRNLKSIYDITPKHMPNVY